MHQNHKPLLTLAFLGLALTSACTPANKCDGYDHVKKMGNDIECWNDDADKDGVRDSLDRCPGTPAGTAVNIDGCASGMPFVDTDKDGIGDPTDQCPTIAGPASNNGCPVMTQPPIDTDGDGTPDATDRCPNVAGPANNQGCPVVTPPTDTDGDGVPDTNDKCPGTPAMTSVDANGCPITCPPGTKLVAGICTGYWGVKIEIVGGDQRLGYQNAGSSPAESDIYNATSVVKDFPNGMSTWTYLLPWGTNVKPATRCWDRDNVIAPVWKKTTDTGIAERPTTWTSICTTDGAQPSGAVLQAVANSLYAAMIRETGSTEAAQAVYADIMSGSFTADLATE